MLVYANHLSFEGPDTEDAVFKAVGGWLKEQLGFGLHPDQLRHNGDFDGKRGEVTSHLQVVAATDGEPHLYAWVLRLRDPNVWGRVWVTEVGLKQTARTIDLTCVVKTDEHSTLVSSPVTASQPRLIKYVARNILASKNAEFASAMPAVTVKSVGEDGDSYRGLDAEIERPGRDCAIVLVSPDAKGAYLLAPVALQDMLLGLAQVVQIVPGANTDEMIEVLGEQRSAWNGSVTILNAPSGGGRIRSRYFLPAEIAGWGTSQLERASKVLAWVTNGTNIARLRQHVRPESVVQLALQRRVDKARADSAKMNAAELRHALDAANKQIAEQQQYFNQLVEENSALEGTVADLKGDLEDAQDDLGKRDFTISTLKEQLQRAGGHRDNTLDIGALVARICDDGPPSPADCLTLIEAVYGERCIVLPSARSSAEHMTRFVNGRLLLDLLRRLVTEYRERLMQGGDSQARSVFGKNEYAAKESETVMANKAMRRKRTFEYDGEMVEMFSHVKIGASDDVTKTIRVHFHWDADREKIVIGYCGEHLPISSR